MFGKRPPQPTSEAFRHLMVADAGSFFAVFHGPQPVASIFKPTATERRFKLVYYGAYIPLDNAEAAGLPAGAMTQAMIEGGLFTTKTEALHAILCLPAGQPFRDLAPGEHQAMTRFIDRFIASREQKDKAELRKYRYKIEHQIRKVDRETPLDLRALAELPADDLVTEFMRIARQG